MVLAALSSCSFVVIILAVIPWGYTWKRYVRTPETPGADFGPLAIVAALPQPPPSCW